jgi:hypothetical protein
MSAAQLIEAYHGFGDDPFVVAPPGTAVAFSAWEYAHERVRAICQ